MFFSPELLAKRDSGFGFLWLAATLGSRSAFKKLPKRSVLTADISQLCDLISEPVEPLALRLSSNLMFGVVRVYKVKQDIFMTDVTNCVTSLKKVVQDIRSLGPVDTQLEMAQPTAKSSALTVTADPRTAYAMDFDALVADWDEFLNIGDRSLGEGDDRDYTEAGSKCARKRKTDTVRAPPTETARRELHTLTEHHDHLFSASFDLSFNRSGLDGPEVSSSQNDVAFDYNDDLFALSDGLDLGDLGDELARELGWEATPAKSIHQTNDIPAFEQDVFINNDFDMEFDLGGHNARQQTTPLTKERETGAFIGKRKNRDAMETQSPENDHGSPAPKQTLSPAISFSRLLLSQDIEQPYIGGLDEHRGSIQPEDATEESATRNAKNKKPRLLLDIRTELTDEELKVSRAGYLQTQTSLKDIMNSKKDTRFSSKVIEELIWGAPKGIYAQSLVDYWQENFKIQVEARSNAFQSREDNDPPRKRFKALHSKSPVAEEQPEIDMSDNIGLGVMGLDYDMAFIEYGSQIQGPGHLRSSEEPGQARHNSRAPSILGGSNFGLDNAEQDLVLGSQRSSLFPWDNAGGSSSNGNAPLLGCGGSVDQADIILRPSSRSRRDSSLIPSQAGSNAMGGRYSPLLVGRDSQAMGEDYAFDLDTAQVLDETQDTQQVDTNLITLEKNSFHFLEYAKMQSQTLPKPGGQLTFDTVVPKSTSTRHVAAAAFYHCLVLATKDLLKLDQSEAYEQLRISVK